MKANSATIELCTNCETKSEFERVIKDDVIKVRGEPITIKAEYVRCKNCGDAVLDTSAKSDPFEFAYREYRRRHGLLQPEDVRDWRRSHHLTQDELAKLLGLGIATINRYENGALQTEAHDKMLRQAMEPTNLAKLIAKSEGIFSEARKKQLLETLEVAEDASCSLDNMLMVNFGSSEPNEFNGYKKLDLTKLYNAILFFSKGGVLKSKLNKLLFYADFKHFKEYILSITGMQYVPLPYGPVPDNYGMYYDTLLAQASLELMEETYPDGHVGEVITAIKEPDLNIFSPSELRVLASVKEDFQKYNATQIKERSHKEAGYQETTKGQIISYKYANRLSY